MDDNKKQERNTNTISATSGVLTHMRKPQVQHSEDQQDEGANDEPSYEINTNPDTLNVTQTVAAQIPEQT